MSSIAAKKSRVCRNVIYYDNRIEKLDLTKASDRKKVGKLTEQRRDAALKCGKKGDQL